MPSPPVIVIVRVLSPLAVEPGFTSRTTRDNHVRNRGARPSAYRRAAGAQRLTTDTQRLTTDTERKARSTWTSRGL